jgi:hypothetical protein
MNYPALRSVDAQLLSLACSPWQQRDECAACMQQWNKQKYFWQRYAGINLRKVMDPATSIMVDKRDDEGSRIFWNVGTSLHSVTYHNTIIFRLEACQNKFGLLPNAIFTTVFMKKFPQTLALGYEVSPRLVHCENYMKGIHAMCRQNALFFSINPLKTKRICFI